MAEPVVPDAPGDPVALPGPLQLGKPKPVGSEGPVRPCGLNWSNFSLSFQEM